MSQLLSTQGQVLNDPYQFFAEAPESLPSQDAIVPLAYWQAHKAELKASAANIGVWLASSETAEDIQDDLPDLPVIGVHFPIFSDGRGYSTARLLAERYGYQGALRAIGDVLIDQAFYMTRVGFTELALRDDQIVENAIKALSTWSDSYQVCAKQPTPLFRRRQA